MSNHIRWIYRTDNEAVESIECLAFDPDDRWTWGRYCRQAQERNTFAVVAEAAGNGPDGWNPVVGVMVYRIGRDRFEVLRLAVHAEFWGGGIGRRLLDRVQGKVAPHRDRVTLDVPDDFLGTHLFLRACGFRATGVDREGAGLGRDLYRFEHRLVVPGPGPSPDASPAYTDWLGRLGRAAVDGGIATRAGWVVGSKVLREAAGDPGCPAALPLPAIHPLSDGRVNLVWRSGGRSVCLHAGSYGAEVRLDPEAFPAWVHETGTSAECLARAFRWLYVDGAARDAAPSPVEEDRQC